MRSASGTGHPRGPDSSVPVLELRGVDKHFGSVHANREVSLVLRRGTVHAILGENGAGKSTLMNILFGVQQPDAGSIVIDGEEKSFATPRDSIDAGVGMVFQHFGLVPELSALDNIALGAEVSRLGKVDRAHARDRITELCLRLKIEIPIEDRVATLTISQQQRVEILKALYRGARILILDEPTALLAPQERQGLFEAIESLQATGVSVLFITHKLDEVERLADDVTVMRHGAVVARHAAGETTQAQLVAEMVGSSTMDFTQAERTPGATIMSVLGLELTHDTPRHLHDVSLEVRGGEVLEVAGIDGHGHQVFCQLLAGMRRPQGGQLTVLGQLQPRWDRRRAMALGVAYVPEDRLVAGVARTLSIAENMVANRLKEPLLARFGLLNRRRVREQACELIDRFDIRCRDELQTVGTLSGGNVQKVVLARELATKPRIVVVCEPTRGLDVAAIAHVHSQLAAAAHDGAAVIVQSSDLDEILSLVDRIAVFRDGRLVADIANGPDVNATTVGELMLGTGAEEVA